MSSKILATRGRIYPRPPLTPPWSPQMDDGSIVRGETNITASHRRIAELTLDPPNPAPLPETIEAIAQRRSDHRRPRLPLHLAYHQYARRGIPSALANAKRPPRLCLQSHDAGQRKPQPHRLQHIERIYEHTRAPIFDCALVNTAPSRRRPSPATRPKALRPSPPMSNAFRPSASAASPETSLAKSLSSATPPAASPEPCSPSAAPPFLRAMRPASNVSHRLQSL